MTENNGNVCEVELRGEEGEVKWGEFMPRMVIRVLLVEADDSTRQILTALLRKCNYKVAAIADGLQAWEILKKRHNCIDLVLTELDLPSISGYALLTLIMEHDRCKNIPVIMMSSQDSISMVLKCILKGAADFLIKPVRKNELKNLWRHVWRRLAINGGKDPQNLATEQHKVETTNSEDNVSTSRKSSKSSGKATDSQDFSWMKHSEEIELSNNEMENRLKNGKIEKEVTLLTIAAEGKATRFESGDLSNNEGDVSATIRDEEDGSCTGLATEDDSIDRTTCKRKANADDLQPSDPCQEVVDLIGSMKRQKCVVAQTSYNGDFSNLNSEPELELSLRRVHDSEPKEVDERRTINHSNASPFSRYNSNKKSQTASPLSISEVTEIKGEADLFACPNTLNSGQDDKPIKGVESDPAPLPGVIYDGGVWTGYAPLHQPMFNSNTGPGADVSERSPSSPFHREESPFLTNTSLDFAAGTRNSTVDNSSSQLEGLEHQLRNSSLQIVGPSSSSTPCSESTDQKKNDALGSSSDITANGPGMEGKSVVKEVKKDDGHNTFELDMLKRKARHQSAEREAALAKFRLKRKGRCYEKKVRYQSRKTLAEQRQRVKGQFVRQVPANTTLTKDVKT